MRRFGACLFLLVLLAGCGLGRSSGDSPEAVCRRQAYDDPEVKHQIIEGMGISAANPDSQFAYRMALRKATDRCLRQRGVQVRGGVEPVRP
jgi:hypothetical protein